MLVLDARRLPNRAAVCFSRLRSALPGLCPWPGIRQFVGRGRESRKVIHVPDECCRERRRRRCPPGGSTRAWDERGQEGGIPVRNLSLKVLRQLSRTAEQRRDHLDRGRHFSDRTNRMPGHRHRYRRDPCAQAAIANARTALSQRILRLASSEMGCSTRLDIPQGKVPSACG